MLCRAVHLDLSTDYSTNEFLTALQRFMSLRGYPSNLRSDTGSQLVAANKELKAVIKGIDKNRLKEFGAENGFDWDFSSSDAQWQNGCSEASLKSVKKMIKNATGSKILMFSELTTVFYKAANLVNKRPIGRQPKDPDDSSYLSPNHLLLGRATLRIPSGAFREMGNLNKRHEFIQKIVDAFWKRWRRDYFPSLLIRQKWHVEKHNIKVGDAVIIQDSNLVRGGWRLGRVSNVFPDDDRRVRNVEIEYKQFSTKQQVNVYVGKEYSTIQWPVQKLVVLIPVNENELEK